MLAYNFLLWYIYAISLGNWICVGIYFKKMISSRSTSLLSLVIFTIVTNIVLLASSIIPQIGEYCNITLYDISGASVSLAIISSCVGTAQFLIFISSKKRFRIIKSIVQQQRNKVKNKRNRRNSKSILIDKRLSRVLIEIQDARERITDGGMLGDLFDEITKEVLHIQALVQIFVAISLRFFLEKYSKKSKKKYLICYDDMEAFSEKFNIGFIKDGSIYLVPINHIELTEYFPEKFEQMKQVHTNSNIFNSLASPYNFQKLVNLIKEEGGKSDAFIFMTHDQKFIIKTISKTDRRLFTSKMLPGYLERIREFPESRLVRILGVYKIKPMKQSVIIMENLLVNKENCIIFDLKGSKIARLVKGIEDPKSPPIGRVLKDMNFIMYGQKIKLNDQSKESLIKTLRMDFNFLRECGVTDYSILLGIYQKQVNIELIGKYLQIADNGICFSIGIIDIFQEYNFIKASEKNIKAIFNKKKDISAAPPLDYFTRIAEFCELIFE